MAEYDSLVKSPEVWRIRAQGQLYVGDTLWLAYSELQRRAFAAARETETIGLVSALAYHYGMALELAAKGAIAEKTEAAPPLNMHKLVALCEEAGFEFTTSERKLAERLTAAIEWWGRYAVPRKAKHFAEAKKRRITRLVIPEDRDVLMTLLDRLGVTADRPPPPVASRHSTFGVQLSLTTRPKSP